MCGIVGVVSLSGQPLSSHRLKPMVDVIAHRGPDDAGYLVWQTGRSGDTKESHGQAFTDAQFHSICPLLPPIDSSAGAERLDDTPWDLFLGHRRLAILDLSARGHQPMSNRTKDTWIVYNGEVYNFRELREELKVCGRTFSSQSDTEVILQAYAEWGIKCVHRFNGMFAFALFDSRRHMLYLVRDRYGVKPLYYRRNDGLFIFGSEIKSILAYLPNRPGVDLLALNEYFSFQNVLSDRTLFSDIRLLPPGHIMSLDVGSCETSCERYWDFDFSQQTDEPYEVVQERVCELIQQAVLRECVSDVPVGCYLSGGMDSGSITSLAVRNFGRISTFTSGFDLSEAAAHEQRFDERELAEHMASLLQTEHYECVLHAGDMEAVIDKLVWHLEDLRVGQCYPNWYVARLASRFVKVVMAGTGGDELFGGYPWRYAAAIGDTHEDYVQNYYRYWQRLVNNSDKRRLFNENTAARLRDLADGELVPFQNDTLLVFRDVFREPPRPANVAEQVNLSLYFECKTFLHGILVVEDKISMAHSLEARVPLLDNDLVDYACRIPVQMKVPGLDHLAKMDENLPKKKAYYQENLLAGKAVLRAAMSRILPPGVTQARKQGFSAPDESWFRGSAEPMLRKRLLGGDARLYQFLNREFVEDVVDAHCSARSNKRLLLWSLLCFESWLRSFQ